MWGKMTEEELIEDFERKARRYLKSLDHAEAEGILPPCAHDYFDAAQHLGADLLLRMIEAHRDYEGMRRQCVAVAAELAAALNEQDELRRSAESEMAGLREQVRTMVAQIEAAITTGAAMEYAGCDAIAALRAVSSNPGLTDAQNALVAEALLGMFAAKPRWLSRSAETGRKSPNSEAAA
jgi:hypothetical protein